MLVLKHPLYTGEHALTSAFFCCGSAALRAGWIIIVAGEVIPVTDEMELVKRNKSDSTERLSSSVKRLYPMQPCSPGTSQPVLPIKITVERGAAI